MQENPSPPERVAVVVVHGVGDHEPYESARSIGDMLQNLKTSTGGLQYTPAHEEVLRLKVDPLQVTSSNGGSRQRWGPMGELYSQAIASPKQAANLARRLDFEFMRTQVEKYRGEKPEDTYQTVRLATERLNDGRPDQTVHIYEMYWADLSRLSSSPLQIFAALYQLLFHVPSLGSNNIKALGVQLQAQHSRALNGSWRVLNWIYTAAAGALTLPVPILNLLLLAVVASILGTSVVLTKLPDYAAAIAAALAGVIILIAFASGPGRNAAVGPAVLAFILLSSTASGSMGWLLLHDNEPATEGFLTLAIGALAIGGAAWVVSRYSRLRPRANVWMIACMLATLAVLGIERRHLAIFSESTDHLALRTCLNACEAIVMLILIVWAVLAALTTLSGLAAAISLAITRFGCRAELDRVRRCLWTATLTMAIPIILFVSVTLPVWRGIVEGGLLLLPHSSSGGTLTYSPLFGGEAQAVRKWAGDTLSDAGERVLPQIVIGVVIAVVIAVWSLSRSVLSELLPPNPSAAKKTSVVLGSWLDSGLKLLFGAGWIVVAAMALSLAYAAAPFAFPQSQPLFESLPGGTLMGTILGGGAVTLLGFGGRLGKLLPGFRAAIRAGLDVDNWMREHPRDSNPTARICGRYVSLLRYLTLWRGTQNKGYDKIVIVAHSQGTVITADLLRFLKILPDPIIRPIRTAFFTMGSPLRQLYGLRFPGLYDWARHPNPATLGVAQWINAYRSGDYIGRYLWFSDANVQRWQPAQATPSALPYQPQLEFCIGGGAHTHYWDSTAPVIAEAIDVLIST